MAYEVPVLCLDFPAGGDLSSNQYYICKLSTAGEVTACTAGGDAPLGILQNNPDSSGKTAQVLIYGVSKVSSDEALEIGNRIGPSADGQAAVKTLNSSANDGEYHLGLVLDPATSAAGEYASAVIYPAQMAFNSAST